jgi:dTDP-4-amino-4,6-dideoxygalactose transaminase
LRGTTGLRHQRREGDIELSYNYYPLCFESERFSREIDGIVQALVAEGVTAWAIAKDETCHTQPLFTERHGRGSANCPFDCHPEIEWPDYRAGTLPNSERLAQELLLLPLFPEMTRADLDDIVGAVRKVSGALLID